MVNGAGKEAVLAILKSGAIKERNSVPASADRVNQLSRTEVVDQVRSWIARAQAEETLFSVL